ncbi:MAG: ATP-dependent DNA helicase, partial [Persicimonas sp.]
MMQTVFTPFGTLAARHADHDRRYERTLEALAAVAGDFQMEPATVWLAHDIAQLQHEAERFDPDNRLAAALLILVLLCEQNRGSTRLKLEFGGEGALYRTLDEFADALGADDREPPPTFDDVDGLVSRIEALVDDGRLDHVMGEAGDFCPLIRDGQTLCTEQNYHRETELIDRLAARLKRARQASDGEADGVTREAIDEVVERSPFGPPTEESERELRTALLETAAGSPLTVVSGGPGTGKTSIIVAIIRTLVRHGVEPTEIALAAPTGKASKRMRESMIDQFELLAEEYEELDEADATLKAALDGDLEPGTLHRLLEYSPYRETFRRGEDDRLDHKAVIVDEASMIDLELMNQLVAAVEKDARLILVGDRDQLPSVGAGAVFADLTGLGGAHAHELVKNYRTEGKQILKAAEAINTGKAPVLDAFDTIDELAEEGWAERPPRAHFEPDGKSKYKPPEGLWLCKPGKSDPFVEFIEAWHTRFVDLRPLFGDPDERAGGDYPYRRQQLQSPFIERTAEDGGGFTDQARRLLDLLFAFYEHSRLLCLTRVRRRGADRVNRLMHRRFRRQHDLTQRARFHAGEPVMVQSNDYDLGLFNGDRGIVLYTR